MPVTLTSDDAAAVVAGNVLAKDLANVPAATTELLNARAIALWRRNVATGELVPDRNAAMALATLAGATTALVSARPVERTNAVTVVPRDCAFLPNSLAKLLRAADDALNARTMSPW